MNRIKNIKAILFDLDGVVYVDNNLIEGSLETIQNIKAGGFKTLFVTNTTVKSIQSIKDKLNSLNVPFEDDEIYSAPIAAIDFLRKQNSPKCFFVLNEDVKKDFKEFQEDEISPEFVIIGDIGNKWNYDLMNKLFKYILNGAKMIALHKGKYWLTEKGFQMDIGAFIHGLEYATNKNALVLGKPSQNFFSAAISKLNVEAYQAAIIGDDIETDIGAAQSLGMLGILVRTGKFRKEFLMNSSIHPDIIIDSIKDLNKYF